jgi:hypothetical protein
MMHGLCSGERRAKYRKMCEEVEGLPAGTARMLSNIEDLIGATIKQWPENARTKMLASRLDFSARFSLYLFLAGNVLPPGVFVDWVVHRKLLRYKESVKHMISVLRSHQTGVNGLTTSPLTTTRMAHT